MVQSTCTMTVHGQLDTFNSALFSNL